MQGGGLCPEAVSMQREDGDPRVLTSSGGRWIGRYASYWNAFLSENKGADLITVEL